MTVYGAETCERDNMTMTIAMLCMMLVAGVVLLSVVAGKRRDRERRPHADACPGGDSSWLAASGDGSDSGDSCDSADGGDAGCDSGGGDGGGGDGGGGGGGGD